MFDGVFAFLQLGDIQLGLAAVQSFEPHLVVVDGGDDGTARKRKQHWRKLGWIRFRRVTSRSEIQPNTGVQLSPNSLRFIVFPPFAIAPPQADGNLFSFSFAAILYGLFRKDVKAGLNT